VWWDYLAKTRIVSGAMKGFRALYNLKQGMYQLYDFSYRNENVFNLFKLNRALGSAGAPLTGSSDPQPARPTVSVTC
jgi:hypothetical protein